MRLSIARRTILLRFSLSVLLKTDVRRASQGLWYIAKVSDRQVSQRIHHDCIADEYD
jgi:hypothetical protein